MCVHDLRRPDAVGDSGDADSADAGDGSEKSHCRRAANQVLLVETSGA